MAIETKKISKQPLLPGSELPVNVLLQVTDPRSPENPVLSCF